MFKSPRTPIPLPNGGTTMYGTTGEAYLDHFSKLAKEYADGIGSNDVELSWIGGEMQGVGDYVLSQLLAGASDRFILDGVIGIRRMQEDLAETHRLPLAVALAFALLMLKQYRYRFLTANRTER
jgi:hypothetical protein